MDDVAENLERVRHEIAEACARAGRPSGEVQLIAVSKTHPADKVRLAVEGGQLVFGESRVQEAKAKIPLLAGRLRWHFIGHLQKNKIRQALPLFELIQSVDSLELAQQIDRIAQEDGLHPRVLIEVNMAGEGSKHGLPPSQATTTISQMLELPRIAIEGLMAIPPLAREPELSRPHFQALRRLRDEMERKLGLKLPQLSMGMSNDFVVAIEEGATMVRVGTGIFGAR